MPVHDWTRVGAGIFHHFHFEWIGDLSRVLNSGLLPPNYYALAEQIAGEFGPDVLTLQLPPRDEVLTEEPSGGVALASAPPMVRFRARAEPDVYAAKSRTVVIRHTSNHHIIAMVEVVSPGNKSSRHAIRAFVERALRVLRSGIHPSSTFRYRLNALTRRLGPPCRLSGVRSWLRRMPRHDCSLERRRSSHSRVTIQGSLGIAPGRTPRPSLAASTERTIWTIPTFRSEIRSAAAGRLQRRAASPA